MKQFYLLLCLILVLKNASFAQVDCDNIGFEKGSLLGWTQSYGTLTDNNQETVYGPEMSGTTGTLHYVTSVSNGNDPNIPSIPMVAPGSTHSLRLGNTVQGGDYSKIKTEYTVSADKTLFQYKFAIVLQNSPDVGRTPHEPFQKPGFNIEIFDSNGSVLPCSNYGIQLQGSATVAGFQAAGDLQYRNWTTGAIDLGNYVGKKITIVVTAHGCTKQRHYGYAYFDAQCSKMEVKPESICPGSDGLMTLMAPEGFGTYRWSNGQTSQKIKVAPKPGDKYSVKVVPPASLDSTCALQLDYTLKFQKMVAALDSTICEGEHVAVGDTTYKTTGTFVRRVSFSPVCDSTVTLKLKVNPIVRYPQTLYICVGDSVTVGDTTYRTTGVYVKTLTAATGCDSVVTTNLTVVPLDLTVAHDQIFIVQGDSTQISALVDPKGTYSYRWEPSTALSCVNCAEPWTKPDRSMIYTVFASDPNKACYKSERVTITVKPCGVYVPDAFSPNQDGKNELLVVYGGHCIKTVRKMAVYNRWGQVVYVRENFAASDQKSGWDGTYRGVVSEPGVYPYKIQVELATGKMADFSGMVTLIR